MDSLASFQLLEDNENNTLASCYLDLWQTIEKAFSSAEFFDIGAQVEGSLSLSNVCPVTIPSA